MMILFRIIVCIVFLGSGALSAYAAVVDSGASRISGLRGTYYDTTGGAITRDERNSDIAAVRTDARIAFRWSKESSPVDSDFFTAEWNGDVRPPSTGTYAFTIISDGAAALWLNDTLLIEGTPSELSQRHPGFHEFSHAQGVFFEVGRTYHLRVKMQHSARAGIAQLWWRTPDGLWEIVPTDNLSAETVPALRPAGNGTGVSTTVTQYVDGATYRASRTDPTVSIDLPSDFQHKGAFRFDASWSGDIEPRVSTFYRFHTTADGPLDFSLQGEDGRATISSTSNGMRDARSGSVFLLAGKRYPFTMTYRHEEGLAHARLMWSSALSPRKELIPRTQLTAPLRAQPQPKKQGAGLAGYYFNGENFEQQTFSRLDPVIDFDWKKGSPKSGPVNTNHFSVKWEGDIEAPRTDFYQFSSRVDDRMKLTIDGHTILDTARVRAGKTNHALPLLLESGRRYRIRIEYAEYIDSAYVNLLWSGSDGRRGVVPREALYGTATTTKGTGLRGEYFAGENFETLKAVHPAEAINFDWRASAPDPAVPPDHFSARWTGWIEAPETADYTFTVKSDDGVRLWIDGKKLIDEWRRVKTYMETYTGEIHLKAGIRYPVKIEYYEDDTVAGIQLFWERRGTRQEIVEKIFLYPAPTTNIPPVVEGAGSGGGLYGEYFVDDHFSMLGSARIDPMIDFLWGESAPHVALPRDHFSARWTGWIEAPETALYTFTVRVDDGVRFWIGARGADTVSGESAALLNEWRRVSAYPTEYRVGKQLERGRYPVRIEYYEEDSPAGIQFFWERTGSAREIIPRQFLYPAPEPVQPRGNGTGLRGRYYKGADTADKVALPYPIFERTDAQVNFPWGEREIDERLATDNYSVRWEGFLQPQYEGAYTFILQADDHAALYINEAQISPTASPLLSTGSNVNQEYTATKTLARDRLYYIRVVFSEYSGDARVRLSWSHARIPKEVIPQTQLYLPNSSVLAPLGL